MTNFVDWGAVIRVQKERAVFGSEQGDFQKPRSPWIYKGFIDCSCAYPVRGELFGSVPAHPQDGGSMPKRSILSFRLRRVMPR